MSEYVNNIYQSVSELLGFNEEEVAEIEEEIEEERKISSVAKEVRQKIKLSIQLEDKKLLLEKDFRNNRIGLKAYERDYDRLNLSEKYFVSERYGIYMMSGHEARDAWIAAKNDLTNARMNVLNYDKLANEDDRYCEAACINRLLLLQTGYSMHIRDMEAKDTAKLLEEIVRQESAANDNEYGKTRDKDIDLETEYKKLAKKDQRKIQKDVKLIKGLENELFDIKEKGVLDGKLKIVAKKASYYMDRYNKYEHSHPILAKTYLISGLVLAKGLIGAGVAGVSTGGIGIIPGFISGITKGTVDEARGAIIGFAIGNDIGEFINKGIEDYSPILLKLDSTLSAQEAAILASISLAALLSSSEFASFAKAVKGADFSGMKISNGKLDGTFYFKKEFPETVRTKITDTSDFSTKLDIKVIPSDTILKDSAKFIGECDFYHPGILTKEYAETFTGSRYKTYALEKDITIYRAGSSQKSLGEYYSFESPASEIQVRMDKALMHKWPTGEVSIIDTVYEVKIPKGTNIYVGDIANQGGFYFGGTEQILIPEAWRIKGIEVLRSYPINKR